MRPLQDSERILILPEGLHLEGMGQHSKGAVDGAAVPQLCWSGALAPPEPHSVTPVN